MKSIGIITIHKINNYGSLFQAYALQKACEDLGYYVEIIDYNFPNEYHQNNRYAEDLRSQPNEPAYIKALFARALIRQHKGNATFVSNYQHLSHRDYALPDELIKDTPHYDVYITGSDQIWNPRYCNGDPAFMLHFAPGAAKKISYAASFGTNAIPADLRPQYEELLGRYHHISVRENSGKAIVQAICNKDAKVVLDPTLLLNHKEWDKIAAPKRQLKKKYILCYYLNYSFNAFPYVDDLARDIQQQTGFEIVRVARPPHKLMLSHTHYRIGATPEEFLALIRDAEIVLTTSFHGTAFGLNYGRPIFSIVKDKNASDSRQISLMHNLGLANQVLSISDGIPAVKDAYYDATKEQSLLEYLRRDSMDYLQNALKK